MFLCSITNPDHFKTSISGASFLKILLYIEALMLMWGETLLYSYYYKIISVSVIPKTQINFQFIKQNEETDILN